jgi:hypothetical protein
MTINRAKLAFAGALLLLCLLAAIAAPAIHKARLNARAKTCLNNLRIIQGAKSCWALENKKSGADPVDWKDITDYIKPGTRLVCPAGGTYTIGVVGTNASCSAPGHVLPTGRAGCGAGTMQSK